MRIKLISLAVSSLLAMPALAQSHVSIYGAVDLGLNHMSGSSSHKNRVGLDSNLQGDSLIGFKGVEDLGNGLKASFVLEYVITPELNQTFTENSQSFIALSGGFGTVALGLMGTPQTDLVETIDPFEGGTVGDVKNAYAMGTALPALRDITALENVIAYISPDFGGFTMTAAFTADGLQDEAAVLKGSKSNAAKIWAFSPIYENGPLYLGLNFHQIKIDANDTDNKVWDLGASYDFEVVKLGALLGQSKLSVGNNNVHNIKQWMTGATVPIGENGNVLASYSHVKDSITDERGNKWALGYTHDLSKRTNLYVAYAKLSKDLTFDDDYTKGFNLGIRHQF